MKIGAVAVASLLALGLSGTRVAAAAQPWNIYANVRFGYEICYPVDLLIPQQEADDGDGRMFLSSAGATLRIWGNYNANGDSLAALTDQMVKDLTGSTGTVSYRQMASSSAVVSGQVDGTIFYAVRRIEKDTVSSFILTYPMNQKAIFDPVAAKLKGCFHAAHAQ
jgi:hypothetical protein